MKVYRTARTAMTALRRNPMRALLTTLGIVIGVGAVIAMMEIGTGSSAAIRKTIATMGANVLLVVPGTAASGGVSFGAGSVTTLTPQDGEAILRESPAIRNVAPIVRAASMKSRPRTESTCPRVRRAIVSQAVNPIPMKMNSSPPIFASSELIA